MTEPVASRPARVTFFEDRAEVVRQATVPASAGKGWVAVAGVTPLLDERSLRVAPVRGAVSVLAARVVRDLGAVPVEAPEALAAIEAEARAARRTLAGAERRAQRAARRRERVEAQLGAWSQGMQLAPEASGEQPDPAAAWRAAYDALEVEDREALAAQEEALSARREAERLALHLEARLEAAREHAPRWQATVEVQLEAQEAGEAELELTYRTPCALWRPEHQALLRTDSGEAPDGTLRLTTLATAWQRTGERWEDVAVAFSTARPGRAARAPDVREDRLRTRAKTDEERRQVVIEVRDQEVTATGLERGAREVAEMPGVDDGGEPLVFAPAQRMTLEPDGQPLRVEVADAELPAAVDRILRPQRSPTAHLRATATHQGATPLLAGPVRLLRQTGADVTAVGRSKLEFIAPGEPFELGFGPDDAVRVQRDQDDERSTVPIIGRQHVERRVTLFLSNLSSDVKTVQVRERIPVSEVEDLTVSLTASEGWRHDVQDGFLDREVELAPRDGQQLGYGYSLKAAARVVLP